MSLCQGDVSRPASESERGQEDRARRRAVHRPPEQARPVARERPQDLRPRGDRGNGREHRGQGPGPVAEPRRHRAGGRSRRADRRVGGRGRRAPLSRPHAAGRTQALVRHRANPVPQGGPRTGRGRELGGERTKAGAAPGRCLRSLCFIASKRQGSRGGGDRRPARRQPAHRPPAPAPRDRRPGPACGLPARQADLGSRDGFHRHRGPGGAGAGLRGVAGVAAHARRDPARADPGQRPRLRPARAARESGRLPSGGGTGATRPVHGGRGRMADGCRPARTSRGGARAGSGRPGARRGVEVGRNRLRLGALGLEHHAAGVARGDPPVRGRREAQGRVGRALRRVGLGASERRRRCPGGGAGRVGGDRARA